MEDIAELIRELRFLSTPGTYGFEPADFGLTKLEHIPKTARELMARAADILEAQ